MVHHSALHSTKSDYDGTSSFRECPINNQQRPRGSRPSLNMSAAGGIAVANIYYNQPTPEKENHVFASSAHSRSGLWWGERWRIDAAVG